MKYSVLYKHTPTELKGKEDEGSFHENWGEHFVGWHPQSLVCGSLEEAEKTLRHITCYGRQWRIVEWDDNDKLNSVQTSPVAEPYVPVSSKEVQPPRAANIVSLWKKCLPALSKEQFGVVALMKRDYFFFAIEKECTDEERAAHSKLIFSVLENEVMPFCAEMGIEEKPYRVRWGLEENKGDQVDLDYFMDHMRSDMQDVIMLRFFGFITAAQARQMLRDCWILGDSITALLNLKLDNEVKSDDLVAIIKTIAAKNEKSVADYKSGKTNAANSLLGQVIKQAKVEGKTADPVATKELILKTLDEM